MAAVLALALLAPHGARAVPPDFENQVWIPDIAEATTLTFLPDGRMLVLIRTGTLLVVPAGSSTPDPTPFLVLTNIDSEGERGLTGIALDPDFETNGWLYLFYTASSPLRDRVSRFTASGNQASLASEVVLWQDNVDADPFHHGGCVRVGVDGRLYISTGDHFNSSDSQSLTSYHGKLLRIDRDGGIPDTNPFFDAGGPNLDEIWARGLRNPFRFSYDAGSGNLYIGDVGGNNAQTAIEELNLGVAGANYGWPQCEGPCGVAGTTDPIFSYPHGGRDASITGGFRYRGSVFPSPYQGAYFYGDYVQNWLRYLTFDVAGNVTGDFPFEPIDGSEDGPFGDPVELVEGPDGALYYVDFSFGWDDGPNPGAIRRIAYVAADQPPTIDQVTATPTTGPGPQLLVSFQVSATDPEGTPLGYDWDFGDGASSTDPEPTHLYTAPGAYTARVTVSDGANPVLSDPLAVTVGLPPVASIDFPAAGSLFRAGDTLVFGGSANDPDGAVGPANFSWTVLLLHESHIHPEAGPIVGVTSASYPVGTTGHDFSGNTRFEIQLVVTDADGLSGFDSIEVFPEEVDLTFDTEPSGLDLILDGISRATPFVHDALIGFEHALEAPDPGTPGAEFRFSAWSDGGPRVRTLTVPVSDLSLVASYEAALPAGLLAAYAFDEGIGTRAADGSGNALDGTLVAAGWGPGVEGSALVLDGANDHLELPNDPLLDLTGDFSLTAWILRSATGGWHAVYQAGDAPGSWGVYLDPQDQMDLSEFTGTDLSAGPAIADTTTWHHVAWVKSGEGPDNVQLYLDGAPTATLSTGAVLASGAKWIGGDSWFGSDDFLGSIDNLRLYGRALSPAEIETDLAFGSGLDADFDGVLDDGDGSGVAGDQPCTAGATTGCDDNCPFTRNADQADVGGIGTAGPDGIGNACQCGDTQPPGTPGYGRVSLSDAGRYNLWLATAGREPAGFATDRCDAGGTSACTLADVARINLSLASPGASVVRQRCAAARP